MLQSKRLASSFKLSYEYMLAESSVSICPIYPGETLKYEAISRCVFFCAFLMVRTCWTINHSTSVFGIVLKNYLLSKYLVIIFVVSIWDWHWNMITTTLWYIARELNEPQQAIRRLATSKINARQQFSPRLKILCTFTQSLGRACWFCVEGC